MRLAILAVALAVVIALAGCTYSFGGGPPETVCGNLECQTGETASSCPQDCGTCTDSDGVNVYAAGTAGDGAGTSIIDSCTGGIVTEGLCYNNLAYSFQRKCPAGCKTNGPGAGLQCIGTGSAIPSSNYCFSPNTATGSNYFVSLGETVCNPDRFEVWTCAIAAGGNAEFQLLEDCSSGYACVQDNDLLGQATAVCEPATGLGTGLVLHYDFDSDSAQVVDKSGNSNNGTPRGYAHWVSDGMPRGGGGYAFDGSGDYIEAADSASLDLTSGLTVAAWVKLAGAGNSTDYRIVDKAYSDRNGYILGGYSGNPPYSYFQGRIGMGADATQVYVANVDSQGIIAPVEDGSRWYHVALTYDGSLLKLYVDAEMVNQVSASRLIAPTKYPLTVGSCRSGYCSLNGTLDDVRVYNHALGATEIQVIYELGNCPVGCAADIECRTLEKCVSIGTCDAHCQQCAVACTSNGDCTAGEKCINPGGCYAECCTAACASDADCAAGQSCVNPNSCTDATCCAVACASNADCSDGDNTNVDTCTQAGTCNASCKHTPVRLQTIYTGSTTCLLRSDGSVLCAGGNDGGELGIGYACVTEDIATPQNVLGVSGAVGMHSTYCAVLGDGKIKCWANVSSGCTLYGATHCPTYLAEIEGITDAVQVAATTNNGCALLSGGNVKCWGTNTYGQLGNGTTIVSSTPVDVIGITDAVKISGRGSVCALLGTGGIKCWGKNNVGQLGNGTTINQSTPVDVIGISNAVDVSVSGSSCAVLDNGSVKCWGNWNIGSDLVPVELAGISNAVQVSTSGGSSSTGSTRCIVLGDGKIKCMGGNYYGTLGNGTTADSWQTPVEVAGISNAMSVSVGGFTTCARLTPGGARCWGNNTFGQYGNGTKIQSLTPVVAFGMS